MEILTDFIIGMFISAARGCVRYPHPQAKVAIDVLRSMPTHHFDGGARLVHQEPWERPN